MTDLSTSLLPTITNKTLNGFVIPGTTIYPDYNGTSLCNVPSSICTWLGVPPLNRRGLKEEWISGVGSSFQHVVLMVMDGMGMNLFHKYLEEGFDDPDLADWKELIPESLLIPLTSVVPSTTSAALTSLWTGHTPAEHGIVGYEVWLKEYSMIANMINHAPVTFVGEQGSLHKAGFKPETFLPVPTLGPHLVKYGVTPYAFLHARISHSGLSSMQMPQVKVQPILTFTDLLVTLRRRLETSITGKTYSYAYWSSLDDLSHRYNPGDERVRMEFKVLLQLLGRFLVELRKKKRRDTLFILTADHGHISTPKNPDFELINHPVVNSSLAMQPSGENRLAYLFVRPGKEEQLINYINQKWPENFTLIPAGDALNSGLFGDGIYHPTITDRLGDWILFPRENAYLWWANKENTLLGRHGGVSQDEMIVPFMMVKA